MGAVENKAGVFSIYRDAVRDQLLPLFYRFGRAVPQVMGTTSQEFLQNGFDNVVKPFREGNYEVVTTLVDERKKHNVRFREGNLAQSLFKFDVLMAEINRKPLAPRNQDEKDTIINTDKGLKDIFNTSPVSSREKIISLMNGYVKNNTARSDLNIILSGDRFSQYENIRQKLIVCKNKAAEEKDEKKLHQLFRDAILFNMAMETLYNNEKEKMELKKFRMPPVSAPKFFNIFRLIAAASAYVQWGLIALSERIESACVKQRASFRRTQLNSNPSLATNIALSVGRSVMTGLSWAARIARTIISIPFLVVSLIATPLAEVGVLVKPVKDWFKGNPKVDRTLMEIKAALSEANKVKDKPVDNTTYAVLEKLRVAANRAYRAAKFNPSLELREAIKDAKEIFDHLPKANAIAKEADLDFKSEDTPAADIDTPGKALDSSPPVHKK